MSRRQNLNMYALCVMSLTCFYQVTKNVENWQFERYAKSQGINLDTLTAAETKNLKLEMTRNLYPGVGIAARVCTTVSNFTKLFI